MTYDLRDQNQAKLRVGDRVLLGDDDPGTIVRIDEVDEGTHGQTVVLFDDGVEDTFPNTWNATGPWDDHRSDYTCEDLTLLNDNHGAF